MLTSLDDQQQHSVTMDATVWCSAAAKALGARCFGQLATSDVPCYVLQNQRLVAERELA